MLCWAGNLINTMDLLNAAADNPIEVFRQLKTAFDRSGKSFNSFTNLQKKAFAEAAKMDVDELGKLLTQDLRTGISQLNDAAKAQQDLKRAAEEATPVIEKLYKIFYVFVGFLTPVIEEVHELVDGFHKWIQKNKETAKTLGLVLTVVAGLTLATMLFFKAYVFGVGIILSTKALLGGKSAVDLLARSWNRSSFWSFSFG